MKTASRREKGEHLLPSLQSTCLARSRRASGLQGRGGATGEPGISTQHTIRMGMTQPQKKTPVFPLLGPSNTLCKVRNYCNFGDIMLT